MNKSYRTVWNEALGAWVAASEITKARGKRSRSGAVTVAVALVLAIGGAEGAKAAVGIDGGTATGDATAISAATCGPGSGAEATNGGLAIGCGSKTEYGDTNI